MFFRLDLSFITVYIVWLIVSSILMRVTLELLYVVGPV